MASDKIENSNELIKPVRYTMRQQAFFKSDAAQIARIELNLMMNDPKYNTRETFSSRESRGMTFLDKHMKYLSEHPKLDPRHYIANLKLMSKKR